MDDRRRLLERLYSREGAAEQPRDYVDPLTGDTVRMTPSAWALAEYDRLHVRSAPPSAGASREDGTGQTARGDGVDDAQDAADDDEFDDERARDDTRGRARLRRIPPAVVGAGAFVLGVLVAAGISTAVLRGMQPPAAPAAASTQTSMPNADTYQPLPGPAIEEFFRTAPRVDNLPAAVTAGFVATSFHEVALGVGLEGSSTIYAAKRLDGLYCLVAVAGPQRAAETCATEEGIADHGLSLSKDAVRDTDGRPLIVTVTWQTDGTISWEAMPSVG
ncbi:hypothetical protein ACO2Q7_06300 [Rathayibacter sp. KR2-224]|uniref:hypothetical protein n=1 Tax=Rathayibacter sp. KR2-224 TaxID=3400913 RepID=UPI003C09B0C0